MGPLRTVLLLWALVFPTYCFAQFDVTGDQLDDLIIVSKNYIDGDLEWKFLSTASGAKGSSTVFGRNNTIPILGPWGPKGQISLATLDFQDARSFIPNAVLKVM